MHPFDQGPSAPPSWPGPTSRPRTRWSKRCCAPPRTFVGGGTATRWLDSGVKALRHPTLGVFRLRHAVLHVGGQPDQHFVAFAHDTPEGTSRFEALAALAPPSDLAS